MTLEELLSASPDKIEKLSDAELERILSPLYTTTRPPEQWNGREENSELPLGIKDKPRPVSFKQKETSLKHKLSRIDSLLARHGIKL